MTQKLTFVSRVSVSLPNDGARWDWRTAENHICVAARIPSVDPPRTLCGKVVVYNRVNKWGTSGGFQWGNSRQAKGEMCPTCVAKLAERNLTLENVNTMHTHIPEWSERCSWWCDE
jgi:hypothetical protein